MDGEEDIAYKNGLATREFFEKYSIKHESSDMPGGHTWYVWRYNLLDLAPLLFRAQYLHNKCPIEEFIIAQKTV